MSYIPCKIESLRRNGTTRVIERTRESIQPPPLYDETSVWRLAATSFYFCMTDVQDKVAMLDAVVSEEKSVAEWGRGTR